MWRLDGRRVRKETDVLWELQMVAWTDYSQGNNELPGVWGDKKVNGEE